MIFRTEFVIDRTNGNGEETYISKLYEITGNLVGEDNFVKIPLTVHYDAKTGRNTVGFSWKSIPDVFTENPGGIFSTKYDKEELNDSIHIREMHKALRNVKWLKKRNISDIATVHCY